MSALLLTPTGSTTHKTYRTRSTNPDILGRVEFRLLNGSNDARLDRVGATSLVGRARNFHAPDVVQLETARGRGCADAAVEDVLVDSIVPDKSAHVTLGELLGRC